MYGVGRKRRGKRRVGKGKEGRGKDGGKVGSMGGREIAKSWRLCI